MFKNAEFIETIASAPEPVALAEPPKVTVVKGAGIVGAQRLAIQIAFTQWRGKVMGASANTLGGKAHRMEVTRLCDYEGMSEDQFSLLQTRIGRKTEDRALRPQARHSLLMYRGGPRGLGNLKPWFHMYKEMQDGIAWCQNQVAISRGSEQLALVMLLDCTEWELITPTNSAYSAYYEGVVTAVMDLEIVRLAAAPLIDGFGDDSIADYEED